MRRQAKYDFGTKMRLNAFVIREIVDALYPDGSGHQDYNDVSIRMLDSDELHRLIGLLSEAIKTETEKQRKMSVSEKVATVWLHGR